MTTERRYRKAHFRHCLLKAGLDKRRLFRRRGIDEMATEFALSWDASDVFSDDARIVKENLSSLKNQLTNIPLGVLSPIHSD